MRAHVPDPHGAASTWPGPHTSAFAETGHVHLDLRVDGLADRRTPLRDALGQIAPHGDAHPGRLDDGEDVAGAERHVDWHLAHRLDLDALSGEQDKGRRPAQGDLADAITISARDRLDDARLRVDDDWSLGAEPLNHPGLDGHGRRADRALAARDVVATRVDEEEPEVSSRRDRLRHHRDQQAAVSSRLEAESRSEVVVMLLKEAPLLADRGPRQSPEAAREQPHPDSSGVKVDRIGMRLLTS